MDQDKSKFLSNTATEAVVNPFLKSNTQPVIAPKVDERKVFNPIKIESVIAPEVKKIVETAPEIKKIMETPKVIAPEVKKIMEIPKVAPVNSVVVNKDLIVGKIE